MFSRSADLPLALWETQLLSELTIPNLRTGNGTSAGGNGNTETALTILRLPCIRRA